MNHQTSLLNSNEELSERSNCRVITLRAGLYGVRLIQANLLEGEPSRLMKASRGMAIDRKSTSIMAVLWLRLCFPLCYAQVFFMVGFRLLQNSILVRVLFAIIVISYKSKVLETPGQPPWFPAFFVGVDLTPPLCTFLYRI